MYDSREIRRRGFTLLELLIVLVIAAILIGLLIVALQRARASAEVVACSNNLKQIGLATHAFHDSQNTLPPDRIRNEWATWAVLLLPYLEQGGIYSQWNLQRRYFEQPAAAREHDLAVYFCPVRRSAGSSGLSVGEVDRLDRYPGDYPGGLSDYASCSGNDHNSGALMIADAEGVTPTGEVVTKNFNDAPAGTRITSWKSQTIFASITDGTSNTLLIGEKFIRGASLNGKNEDRSVFGSQLPWTYRRLVGTKGAHAFTIVSDSNATSETWPDCQLSFGGTHPGICNFVWVDGSVRSLSVNTGVAELQRFGQRGDGKVVAWPE